jgi:single-stranded-DNA-specific exonuclease
MVLSNEKEWVIKEPIPMTIQKELNGYPKIVQQLLYNRGILNQQQAEEYLTHTINHNPFLFSQMDHAVEIILQKIKDNEKIAVYGDYDVDGITATALLSQVLISHHADVWPYIPNRFDEGYGVNTNALDSLAEAGIKLLITVDCGIRSPEELYYAKKLGMQVIITDHHAPSEVIPDVDAIICQHLNDLYPDKYLSGVGLAYKLAQAIFIKQGKAVELADEWLDLAALGTVADVVPLMGENRRIVNIGLSRIRLAKRLGLTALIRASNLRLGEFSSINISFGIAPRLNAAGRLETPQLALDLLMTEDINQAALLAQRLDDLNRERQKITREMQMKAEEMINPENLLLFAVDSEFSSGLVGLVAAKLTEFYYRPAIIAYQGEKYTRASCRSIQEFNITQALDECENLLVQHGGHAMAAGFTVENDKLDFLQQKLNEIAHRELSEMGLRPVISADMVIPLEEIPADILTQLDHLEPIGSENPQAVFVSKGVQVVRSKAVGKDESHLKLTLKGNQSSVYDAIAFHQGHWSKVLPKNIDIIYTIERNFFNGNIYTQLNIRDIKSS